MRNSMYLRWIVCFCVSTFYIHITSQELIPLYTSSIPNNKSNITIQEQLTERKFADGRPGNFVRKISNPSITVYTVDRNVKNTGKAVIICPGGGYGGLAIDHEGHEIAKLFSQHGITGIVLKYRCPDEEIVENKTIVPMQDVHRAMQLTRLHAKKWKIGKNKIGIMGSSAGGHLASTALTHFTSTNIDNTIGANLRPDFGILNYPVISFADSITHRGSRNSLIKINDQLDESSVKLYSNELQVTHLTPPVFINHSMDDKVVPIANSILFAAACKQFGISVSTYFYSGGGHGYGIKNPTANKQWIDECIVWIKQL